MCKQITAKQLNRTICANRVYVKHVVGEIKLWEVVGGLYRHPRRKLAQNVELCAGSALTEAYSVVGHVIIYTL